MLDNMNVSSLGIVFQRSFNNAQLYLCGCQEAKEYQAKTKQISNNVVM